MLHDFLRVAGAIVFGALCSIYMLGLFAVTSAWVDSLWGSRRDKAGGWGWGMVACLGAVAFSASMVWLSIHL